VGVANEYEEKINRIKGNERDVERERAETKSGWR
jgi:hypothetical protein